MIKYLLLFGVSCLLSMAATPLVRRLALRIGAVDVPDERKVHERPIPRLGGVAIFIAFNLTLLLFVSPIAFFSDPFLRVTHHWWTQFLAASLIVVAVGILDDMRPLGAKVKFLIQVAAALVAYSQGYRIEQIGLPGVGLLDLGLWGIPVTVLWIVGITNAFNLIDGLDGLAGGVALISTLTLGGVALLNQQVELVLVSSVLAGSLLGFLRYNLPPASIFLGDSGSLFLGFTLAVMSITTANKATATASILIPLLAFGVPIIDTGLAMMRRFLRATHVVGAAEQGRLRFFYLRGRSMFEADRDHVHHRLMQLGINRRNAVWVLYGISALAGCAALALSALRDVNTGLLLMAAGGATCVAVQKLRYRELQWLRSGAFLPATRWRLMGYESFQVLTDMALVSAAYYLAWLIQGEGRFEAAHKAGFIRSFPLLLLSQLAVFHATGLYRIKWQHAGVTDLLHAVRSVFLGSLAGMMAVHYFLPGSFNVWVLIVEFLIMSLLVLGSRFSVRLLEHYSRPEEGEGPKALIYGAGRAAAMLLEEIKSNEQHRLAVVGFIDDDPRKHKKRFRGYPVLGTGADVEAVIGRSGARELIIASSKIGRDRLAQVVHYCGRNGIALRRFQVRLDEVPVPASSAAGAPAASGAAASRSEAHG